MTSYAVGCTGRRGDRSAERVQSIPVCPTLLCHLLSSMFRFVELRQWCFLSSAVTATAVALLAYCAAALSLGLGSDEGST